MNSFRYLSDRLFLASCALYAGNRWLLKQHVRSAFLHNHFNDLLLIPCALPPLLWMQRKLHLRDNDNLPSISEITLNEPSSVNSLRSNRSAVGAPRSQRHI